MKQCDIVVSATSAPHVVVKQEYYTPEKQVTFFRSLQHQEILIQNFQMTQR